jgi:polyhydroxyalkanoate synthase
MADYVARAATQGGEGQRCIQPLPQDRRFTADEWDRLPFGLFQQAFLLGQQWLDAAVRENSGVTPHHNAVVRFVMRQFLDMFSPSNFIATNPVVQKRFLETGCISLVRGMQLLAIVAAAMARDADQRLTSLTFLATQVDFAEPGEIGLFIDEAQVGFLENLMWQQGYLDSRQMGGAFEMLRSADLVWPRGVQTYLLGERAPMTDLMVWNADGTRMPYAMYGQYLRRLFLHNDLAEGRYQVGNSRVLLHDITVPTYVLGTEHDHVAPWHSVWNLLDLMESDVQFVLASGGHNGGIVAPPGRAGLHYRRLDRAMGSGQVDRDTWFGTTAPHAGSWWPDWIAWLAGHSGSPVPPPPQGRAESGYPVLGIAPGRYVHQH